MKLNNHQEGKANIQKVSDETEDCRLEQKSHEVSELNNDKQKVCDGMTHIGNTTCKVSEVQQPLVIVRKSSSITSVSGNCGIPLCMTDPDLSMTPLQIAHYVIQTGQINAAGARIPLKSNWNLRLVDSLCESDSDRRVLTFLRYGWPLNRLEGPVEKTWKNHGSAQKFPIQVEEYLHKEIKADTLLGPFVTSPFEEKITGISPLSTTPKKDSEKRRIIVDLSWPKENGYSVNSLIPKETYLGVWVKLRYPTIDDICRRAYQLGPCLGSKKDMSRAFLQIKMDPLAWSSMGIAWCKAILFYTTAVMGCRSAPLICQETTNLIRHIMANINYVIFNYVDDFMSIELEDKAWEAYETLGRLLRDLGVDEAVDKAIPPSPELEMLGIWFNLKKLTFSLPQKKKCEILEILQKWKNKRQMTKNQLQKLVGKLQFAASCVRPGRVFVNRLYDKITELNDEEKVDITTEVKKDIDWWQKFMCVYDGQSIMWMHQKINQEPVMSSDASLKGIGGICGERYYKLEITENMIKNNGWHIAHLEMWALVIMLRLWAPKFEGYRFVVECDNKQVLYAINGSRMADLQMQEGLREIAWILATNRCEIFVKYVPSKQNIIPDLLSRWWSMQARDQFLKLKQQNWVQENIDTNEFKLTYNW